MTNREYLENNKIAFDKAIGEYNASGLESFDEWLNQERHVWEFKVGDFLKYNTNDSYIYVVVGLDTNCMYMKRILRNGEFDTHESFADTIPAKWQNQDIYFVTWVQQSTLTKIF